MKKTVAKKWVAALRSGEFKQGKAYLRSRGNYCCLGVLCELYRQETGRGRWEPVIGLPGVLKFIVGGATASATHTALPAAVADWAGMHGAGGELAYENDGGETFDTIADIIEDWGKYL